MLKQILQFLKDHITLTVTACSGYIYFCIYEYEKAYLKAFNVPAIYINIDISTILLDATYVITFLTMGFITLIGVNRFVHFIKLKSSKWGFILQYTSFNVGLYFLLTYFLESSQATHNFQLYIYGGFELIILLIGLIFIKIKKEVPETFNKNLELRELIKQFRLILILGLFFFAFFYIDQIATGQASHQTKFQVVDSTNLIVIRKYGDQIICVDYDTTKKIIENKIVLIKLYTNKPLQFTTQDLGRLADREGQLENYQNEVNHLKHIKKQQTKSSPTKSK